MHLTLKSNSYPGKIHETTSIAQPTVGNRAFCHLFDFMSGRLILTGENIDLEKGIVKVYDAWKDIDESGLPKWNNTRITPVLLFRKRTLSRLKELKLGSNKSGPKNLIFCYLESTI